jgi:hypothetical protein
MQYAFNNKTSGYISNNTYVILQCYKKVKLSLYRPGEALRSPGD